MIAQAGLPARAAERAAAVFTRLARAEAQVHGIGEEEVHFHEVGAIDSIADVVGACLALELLGIDRVVCSPIPVGRGVVRCDHGEFPVPAPATAELLRGVPAFAGGVEGEATTPTAAAVLVTLAEAFGPLPGMEVRSVGYGAGSRDGGALPNVLRVFLGVPSGEGEVDTVYELSANLDDCTGEVIAAAIGRLLPAGCLDAWAAPVVMKKSRPAWILHALCAPGDLEEIERIVLTETTTFGVRRRLCQRRKLRRAHETVETPYGPIRVKVGRLDGRAVTASPEFADCDAAAEAHHVPVREVQAAAAAAWRKETDRS